MLVMRDAVGHGRGALDQILHHREHVYMYTSYVREE